MNVTARRTGNATAADVVSFEVEVVVVVLLLEEVDRREKIVRADRVERLEDCVWIEWAQEKGVLSSVLWRGRWGGGGSEVGGCGVESVDGVLKSLL